MIPIRNKMKAIFTAFLSLIVLTFTVTNCNATPERLKIQKIALLNPVSSKNAVNSSINFVNLYFQKYAAARTQVSLIPFDPQGEPLTLPELKNNGYDLVVIPNFKNGKRKYSLDIYQLSQIQKLWSLSNRLSSDMELLFSILDRSLTSGIKMASNNKIHLGIVPGKDGDLGKSFPCSNIYRNLSQLSNFKITPVSQKAYKQPIKQIKEITSEFHLDYLLVYKSEEFNLSKPLITGTILEPDGTTYGELAVRIESNRLAVLAHNPNQSASQHTPSNVSGFSGNSVDPGQTQKNFDETESICVKSDYLSSVADELANYFLAVLLTEYCHPQDAPLRLRLTKQYKYIKGKSFSLPPIDNRQPKYMIQFNIN